MSLDLLKTLYSEKYPEKKYDEDEDLLYADIHADIEGLTGYKSESEKNNEALIALLKSHKNVAGFLKDLMDGASESEALARNFDLEKLTPVEGDPDMEAWEKGKKDRADRLAKQDGWEVNFQTNSHKTAANLKIFAEKHGLDEVAAMEFLESVNNLISDGMDGLIEVETLEKLYTAANAEAEKEEAVETARIEERNTKIEEQLRKDDEKKDDGVPSLNSGKEIKKTEEKPKHGFEGAFISNARRPRI